MQAIKHHWDALLAGLFGVLFWIFAGLSDDPMVNASKLLIVAIPMGVAIGTAAFVTGRWVDDRLTKDEYAQLILHFDENQSNLRRPYTIVALSGFALTVTSTLLYVSYRQFPRPFEVIFYGLGLALGLYSVLSSISIVFITLGHQRRAAKVRSIKERAARESRLKREKP